jgi:fatty acid/phospholipid biosynthesis enzyme
MASKLWDMAARGMKTGAPLFGVNGTVIVGHGASKAEAVVGSVGTARMLIERQVLEGIREEMARIHSLVQPD